MIVEPVAGNMNLVAPSPAFLHALRELCTRHGAVLIFDEVMTGFRVGLGGAQALYGITPDLTTLGKVIGGGMPVGAFGGRRDIMESIAPLGPVYQAGTLSGNPVAVAAGLATLKVVQAPGFYEGSRATTHALCERLTAGGAAARDSPFRRSAIGGMFGLYFRRDAAANLRRSHAVRREAFNAFFHAMLRQGVYLAPSAYEAGFVSSAAHGEAEIEHTTRGEQPARAFARTRQERHARRVMRQRQAGDVLARPPRYLCRSCAQRCTPHHPVGVVGALAGAERLQLLVRVLGVLSGQPRKLSRDAGAVRAMAGRAGRDACCGSPAAIDRLCPSFTSFGIARRARLRLLRLRNTAARFAMSSAREARDDARHHRAWPVRGLAAFGLEVQ